MTLSLAPNTAPFTLLTCRLATWLGLTVGCAQCHTHKYDPLPHSSYYALTAFLDAAHARWDALVAGLAKARDILT